MRPASRTAVVGLGPGLEVAVLGAQRAGRGVGVEADRVGIDALGAQRVELREPLLALVAQLLLGRSGASGSGRIRSASFRS